MPTPCLKGAQHHFQGGVHGARGHSCRQSCQGLRVPLWVGQPLRRALGSGVDCPALVCLGTQGKALSPQLPTKQQTEAPGFLVVCGHTLPSTRKAWVQGKHTPGPPLTPGLDPAPARPRPQPRAANLSKCGAPRRAGRGRATSPGTTLPPLRATPPGHKPRAGIPTAGSLSGNVVSQLKKVLFIFAMSFHTKAIET